MATELIKLIGRKVVCNDMLYEGLGVGPLQSQPGPVTEAQLRATLVSAYNRELGKIISNNGQLFIADGQPLVPIVSLDPSLLFTIANVAFIHPGFYRVTP